MIFHLLWVVVASAMVKTVNLEEEGMHAIQNLVDGMLFNASLDGTGDRA